MMARVARGLIWVDMKLLQGNSSVSKKNWIRLGYAYEINFLTNVVNSQPSAGLPFAVVAGGGG